MPPGRPRSDAPGQRSVRTALLGVLTPVVDSAGFDLEDLSVTAIGRRHVVRVVVDRDGGIDLDGIAAISRDISTALDEDSVANLIDGTYQLEVSSPGIDRPLTEPRHWRRATGRLVRVEVGGQPLVGRVLSADTTGVALAIVGAVKSSTVREVTFSELGPGRVEVEFNRDGDSESRAAVQAEEG